jgi:uncharacterized protein (UPF0212 family)
MEAYLDTCITKCPSCGTYFAEASWYAVNLGSDLECGRCGDSFNAKERCTDRVLVKFKLSRAGEVETLELASHV